MATRAARYLMIIPLMQLTEQEREAHDAAWALPTDTLRQHAFELLDLELRARLQISPRRYYFIESGVIRIDMLRDRVPPVHKISKSDL